MIHAKSRKLLEDWLQTAHKLSYCAAASFLNVPEVNSSPAEKMEAEIPSRTPHHMREMLQVGNCMTLRELLAMTSRELP